ncbi:MAG: hypothetical protein M0R80_25840 [Proteobacteria bacterium]|jgi:hypothetical protein|nr:hypothetical protein [Pseudomonadota bacterium]
MARQKELFPRPTTAIHVDPDRDEPRVWVRRLVLWSRPGEVIREIPLRRGLNIVWSPDPAEEAARAGRTGGIGHGAGKTLLCRLLRYCLGEETFANEELREHIGRAFPDGQVGAEVVVNGEPWGVVRPLGATRRHLSAVGVPPEDLLAHEGRAPGMDPLLEAITGQVLRLGAAGDVFPSPKKWKQWLLGLAWLSRDQECRFGKILEWRDSSAETKSTLPAIGAEATQVVVRTFLDVMSAAELKTRTRLDTLAQEKQTLGQNLGFVERMISELGRQLAHALKRDEAFLGTERLAATAMVDQATEALRAVEEAGAHDVADPALPGLRSKLEVVIQQIAVLVSQRGMADGAIATQREMIAVLRGELENLDADAIKVRLGPSCPVCAVPIDQALAEGCRISLARRDPADVAAEKADTAGKVAEHERAIRTFEAQIAEKDVALENLRADETALRDQIGAIERKMATARNRRREKWYAARRVLDDARRYTDLFDQRERLREQIGKAHDEEEQLKTRRKSQQKRHTEVVGRLSTLFNWVCRELLDTEVDTHVDLSGRGIEVRVPTVGGNAIESLKVVAFDLAALLMSIEGRSALPAFLIHDSPREGDLGLSIYHRLFKLMVDLEHRCPEPPFQYIITTTTKPPEALIDKRHLRLTLRGEKPEERLLRTGV